MNFKFFFMCSFMVIFLSSDSCNSSWQYCTMSELVLLCQELWRLSTLKFEISSSFLLLLVHRGKTTEMNVDIYIQVSFSSLWNSWYFSHYILLCVIKCDFSCIIVLSCSTLHSNSKLHSAWTMKVSLTWPRLLYHIKNWPL